MKIKIGHINGQIVQTMTTFPADMPDFIGIETDLSDVDLFATKYLVVTAEMADRPVMDLPAEVSLALGGAVTFAVPEGATVSLGQVAPVSIEGGVLALSGAIADTYALTIRAWPYRDHHMTVTVAEA